MCNSSSFISAILPPRILTKLAESERYRARALRTITLTEQTRGRRSFMRGLLGGVPAGELRRTIYDEHHKENLPGKLVRGEGEPATKDVCVTEAYDIRARPTTSTTRSSLVTP
jgi:hypothetical protein